MSGYGRRQDSGPAYLANYEPVQDRIDKFRRDHPLGRITTSLDLSDGHVLSITEVAVLVGERHVVIANGHAYDKLGTPSQLEKTETEAVGRALVRAGYLSDKEKAAASR